MPKLRGGIDYGFFVPLAGAASTPNLANLNIKGFAKHPENPVLVEGPDGAWDDKNVENPFVWREDKWRALYQSNGSGLPAGHNWAVGLAESDDAVSWSKNANNPVLMGSQDWEKGSSGDYLVFGPCVIKEGDTYYCFYTGDADPYPKIGLAWSTDLVNWTKESTNPVVPSPYAVPSVFEEGGVYHMFCQDFENGGTCYTTSLDKKNWRTPVKVSDYQLESVVKAGDNLYLATACFIRGPVGEWKIPMLLWSTDKLSWLPIQPPILSPGSDGAWDADSYLIHSNLVVDRGKLYVFYVRENKEPSEMGFAVAYPNSVESDYFIETDGTVWNNASIDAGDTTYGVLTEYCESINIYVIADSAATISVDTQEPDGDWQTCTTRDISADTLESILLSGKMRGVRISCDTACTITAWHQLS